MNRRSAKSLTRVTKRTSGPLEKKAARRPPRGAKESAHDAQADPNRYPKGWNRKRVQGLIHYYENQTDDAAIAEAEAAYRAVTSTMIQVPVRLVSRVRKLLATRA
jgi:hypothetical protein